MVKLWLTVEIVCFLISVIGIALYLIYMKLKGVRHE